MSIFHLIYASTAAPDLKPVDLERILDASVRNNKRSDITGMLLYIEGTFLQALEGDEAAVTGAYRRIEGDPRHQGLVVIQSSPIKSRSFPDWRMGFKYLGAEELSKRDSYRNHINNDFYSKVRDLKPDTALAMLREFSI